MNDRNELQALRKMRRNTVRFRSNSLPERITKQRIIQRLDNKICTVKTSMELNTRHVLTGFTIELGVKLILSGRKYNHGKCSN
jgi:hypothetical protein